MTVREQSHQESLLSTQAIQTDRVEVSAATAEAAAPAVAPALQQVAAAVAGVVVQLQSLEPQVAEGVVVASPIVGAYTSTGSAGTLLFTLPQTVHPTPSGSLSPFQPKWQVSILHVSSSQL